MKKKGIIIIVFLILLGSVGFVSYSYYKVKQWDNLVYPGVKIETMDLSGKTKEQAQKIIKEKYSNIVLSKKIIITTPDKDYNIDYSKLDSKYNINEVIDKAFSYGKNEGVFGKYKLINFSTENQLKLKFDYNNKIIDEVVKAVENDVNKAPINAKLKKLDNGGFDVSESIVGQKLQTDKLKKEIINNINGDLSKIVVGIKAPMEKLLPKIKAADLKVVNTIIDSYSTSFPNSSESRCTNIELATKSINGTVLMPGDVFSFNDIVGERTEEKGYQKAHQIVGDEFVDGLGGGICQVSSTLYNAALLCNLKSVLRIGHTIPSHYVPLGQDATVDYENIDYKFRNTLKDPIYIEGIVSNKTVYFNIYSTSMQAKTKCTIQNDVYKTVAPDSVIDYDANLADGVREYVKDGRQGYKVKVYRTVYNNGKLITRETISDDYYRPSSQVVKVGTKKEVIVPKKPTETKVPPTTPVDNQNTTVQADDKNPTTPR